ncbi:interleukin-1 beta [Trachinotus anak]|uniref:interleukin-1 beta n=1 Tax=Trachinotus anak TaxID=443729 RepID=UPI0039F18430
MCDFDLSQALDGPLGPDNTECESRCFEMTDMKDEIIKLDVGLDLVVSHNPRTMKSVATVLLAVNRMKKPPTRSPWELSDNELCAVIMDSLLDETIVKTVADVSTGKERIIFQRTSSWECTLCDSSQKAIICKSEELKLQAATLKGGYGDRKVNFKLVNYVSTGPCRPNGQTVVLSIKNHNLYIACNMEGNRAQLNLEECSEENLRRISNDGNMDRFLFQVGTTGVNVTTFESVKYRGWFISTSSEDDNQPVEMCKVDAHQRVTAFRMNY